MTKTLLEREGYRFVERGIIELNGLPDYRLQKQDHYTKRWNDILNKMILEGEENKLSEAFILKIYKAIQQESINHQNKVITKK